ncbi:GNAT family N-acetyltransferase [Flammeovirga pacifica]|uniref:BioF2-like acetyltransferase domain-containing protein n=1 Tax=Flammeovirga pacifica TaxID=915059 RepID=A0A1S1YTP3_FLAPC|nr:GNAT family N-acetyltransferase [Flammeovirga pacifica]OHX64389.1 hypothetical protein NH26_22615 [Flammeovirga pacifica]
MIIKRLKSNLINEKEWDEFIRIHAHSFLYAQSWFLNLFDEKWGAYIAYDNKKIIGILPYQYKIQLGIVKILNNPFVNELGVITDENYDGVKEKLLQSFTALQFISLYKFNVNNSFNTSKIISLETTHHLSLNSDYDTLFKNYSKNLKRKLKVANNITIEKTEDLSTLIHLFKKHVAQKIYGIEEHQYDLLQRIYQEFKSRGIGQVYIAKEVDEVLCAVLMVQQGNRLIYYFAASSPKGKELNASAFLIDFLIKKNASSNLIFDFEGGDIQGLAQFYGSFGSDKKSIPVLRQMLTDKIKSYLHLI